MKKRMGLVAAAMTLTLGVVGCNNKSAGTETPAATTEEVRTTEVAATEDARTTAAPTTTAPTTTEAPVSTTAQLTSAEVTETEEEKKLLSISEANFPDAAFRGFVAGEFDEDQDGSLSEEELAAVDGLYVSRKGIADLTGIEYFTNLIVLDCGQNQLKEVDVSRNTALYTLLCYSNQLTKLDLSQNPRLCILNCYDNQLESLDLSSNPQLDDLTCHHNPLTDLKVCEDDYIGIVVDEGVNIIGNENNKSEVCFIARDPATRTTIYPDGEYYSYVIDNESERRMLESELHAWCTSAKAENGFLYVEGYLKPFVGDGHVCVPLAENVKYYTPGDTALGFEEEIYTQEDFNKGFGPIIVITIENGVVTELSMTA